MSHNIFSQEGFKPHGLHFPQAALGELKIPLEQSGKDEIKLLVKLSLYQLQIRIPVHSIMVQLQDAFLVLLEDETPVACQEFASNLSSQDKEVLVTFRDIRPDRKYSLRWQDKNGDIRSTIFHNIQGNRFKDWLQPDQQDPDFLLYDALKIKFESPDGKTKEPCECLITFSDGTHQRIHSNPSGEISLPKVPPGTVYLNKLEPLKKQKK